MSGKALLRQLYGFVWCTTCQHEHIPNIPVVSFACGPRCGFGVWSLDMAEQHATDYPDHLVHAVHHQTVPLLVDAAPCGRCGEPLINPGGQWPGAAAYHEFCAGVVYGEHEYHGRGPGL